MADTPTNRLKLVCDSRFVVPVVVDTREQRGFDFYGIAPDLIEIPYAFADMLCDKADGGQELTVPTVVGTLASGDYSLRGYESRVAIERKSPSDIYSTISQGRERFERELERLAAMEFAAVVIECTEVELYTDPPARSQLPPKIVSRSIDAWRVRYGVHFIAPGPRRLAEVKTFRLLERFLKEKATVEEVERATAEVQYGMLLVRLNDLLDADHELLDADRDGGEADVIRAKMDGCWARMGSDAHTRVRALSVELNRAKNANGGAA